MIATLWIAPPCGCRLAEIGKSFIDKQHFVGAMFDPIEGHLDPWGLRAWPAPNRRSATPA
jgi:hypothetical protein